MFVKQTSSAKFVAYFYACVRLSQLTSHFMHWKKCNNIRIYLKTGEFHYTRRKDEIVSVSKCQKMKFGAKWKIARIRRKC